MNTVFVLALVVLTASPDGAVIDSAVAYAGAWVPDKDQSAQIVAAEKSCGSMFAKKRGAHNANQRITNLRSAQCRLPGLEASTVTAVNGRAEGEGPGWTLTRGGFSADQNGAGLLMVAHTAPCFNANGKQALIWVEVISAQRFFGMSGPVAHIAYDMLLLLEEKQLGSWTVVRSAVLEERPLN